MKKPPSIYRSPWGHNIILADLTIIMKGDNNNNNRVLWGTIITIWGLWRYNNNNKGLHK